MAEAQQQKPETTALQLVQRKLNDVAFQQQVTDVCSGWIEPKRLASLVIGEMRRNPTLAQCTWVSITDATMQSVKTKLEIGPVLKQAWLVPRKNKDKVWEASFQIGYMGYAELARRAEPTFVLEQVEPVFERDSFTYRLGLNPALDYEPYLGEEDPGKLRCVFVQWSIRGKSVFRVIGLRKIHERRAKSAAYQNFQRYNTPCPWTTDYVAMCVKTAVCACAGLWPMSVEYRDAIEHEERIDMGEVPYAEVVPEPSTLDRAADDLERKKAGRPLGSKNKPRDSAPPPATPEPAPEPEPGPHPDDVPWDEGLAEEEPQTAEEPPAESKPATADQEMINHVNSLDNEACYANIVKESQERSIPWPHVRTFAGEPVREADLGRKREILLALCTGKIS